MDGNKSNNVTDRLTFLAETFDVFEPERPIDEWKVDEWEPEEIKSFHGTRIAVVCSKKNAKGRVLKKVSICNDVFASIITADPTENRMYMQWILNLLSRHLRTGNFEEIQKAIRLVEEDLPIAKEYLELFDSNKRKQRFKNLIKGSFVLKGIEDPTDINQYRSLSELFDAVDPFIEKNPSEMEKLIQKFVDSGQAVIPVKDRRFTVYIPKTRDASVIFNNYAGWCTCKPGNGNFSSYKSNYKKPNGQESDIYIIIDNKFYTGESDYLVQNNLYIDYLVQFGFSESLFEFIEDNAPSIHFMKKKMSKLPDLSKFTEVDEFVIADAGLTELHPSVCSLPKIEMLILPNNKLHSLPSEIGNMKNLLFLNIKGNPISSIPTDIQYLDKTRGGKLFKVAVNKADIGAENYQKLKELLPSVDIS
jgi:hypothetical protein